MLTFPFAEPPQPGELIAVAPGVRWLRMPLPFALNHINLWVLDHGDEIIVVDTGVDTEPTRALWRELFAGPLAGRRIARLICTHFHPDHMGLAGWFAGEFGVPVHMTPKEFAAGRFVHGLSSADFVARVSAMFLRGGIPAPQVRAYAEQRREQVKTMTLVPPAVVEIDPSRPETAAGAAWRIIIGEGHAPQLVTLYNEETGVLISSDQVLPQISPNVSVQFASPDDDPLKRFLDSLLRFKALPEPTLVLPSHRMPFVGLHERVDALIAHHHERLDLARRACAAPATAAAVMTQLFPQRLNAHQMFFAMGETVAHLNYLIGQGEMTRDRNGADVDIYRMK